MLRAVGAVLAGLVLFDLAERLLNAAALHLWLDYAAAQPDRSYTLGMLVVRLVVLGALAIGAGAITATIAQGQRYPEMWLALLLVGFTAYAHHAIWGQYPTWYHIVFIGYLAPLSLLGGLLARKAGLSA